MQPELCYEPDRQSQFPVASFFTDNLWVLARVTVPFANPDWD